MIRIRNSREVFGGLSMLAIGAFFIWFGQGLEFGDSFQMGPGYFPVVLSLILLVLGMLLVGNALVGSRETHEGETFNLKAFALVIGAPVFFGLALNRIGLAPTVFVMIVAVATASRYANWRHSTVSGLFLSVCSVVIFTRLLSLPIDAFGPWLTFQR